MKTVFTSDYSVITFATNKISYLKFALNCARSVLQYNEIKFYIVSDLKINVPSALKKNVLTIAALPEHLNQGIGIKLYIDKYLQTTHTLFIDADCLCYSSLKPLFNLFSNKNVSVVGNIVNAEDWVGETQARNIYTTFGITKLPRFNGGVYYVSKSEQAVKVFNKARKIALDYDQLSFQRIHQKWINEEILIAIAMMLNNELPVPDNGFLMTDLYTDQHTSNLNVLTSFRQIKNPSIGCKLHRSWYPTGTLNPVIIHFGSSNLYRYPYLSQHILLKLKSKKMSIRLVSVLTAIFIHIPFKIKYWFFAKLSHR